MTTKDMVDIVKNANENEFIDYKGYFDQAKNALVDKKVFIDNDHSKQPEVSFVSWDNNLHRISRTENKLKAVYIPEVPEFNEEEKVSKPTKKISKKELRIFGNKKNVEENDTEDEVQGDCFVEEPKIVGMTSHPVGMASGMVRKSISKAMPAPKSEWENISASAMPPYASDVCAFVEVQKKYMPTNTVEHTGVIEESDMIDSIKKSMTILRNKFHTSVVVFVIDKEQPHNNVLHNIRCNGTKPIGSGLYDYNTDCFVVQCVEIFEIGSLPFSFCAVMPMASSWKISIPIPEEVIVNTLSPMSRKNYELFKSRYDNKRYQMEFIQMLR